MNYKISSSAISDLEEIWLFTLNNWSLDQADRYFNLIMNEIEYLSINPKSGKDYLFIREGYYCSKVKSHLIFYKLNVNVVEVMRILHQKMDIEIQLTDE